MDISERELIVRMSKYLEHWTNCPRGGGWKAMFGDKCECGLDELRKIVNEYITRTKDNENG